MAIKIPTSSIAKPSTIYPNWDFGFENIPSDNPALMTSKTNFLASSGHAAEMGMVINSSMFKVNVVLKKSCIAAVEMVYSNPGYLHRNKIINILK
jgi:hypothetical protein